MAAAVVVVVLYLLYLLCSTTTTSPRTSTSVCAGFRLLWLWRSGREAREVDVIGKSRWHRWCWGVEWWRLLWGGRVARSVCAGGGEEEERCDRNCVSWGAGAGLLLG